MTKNKRFRVLVMSVGEYQDNGTARWSKRLGGVEETIVVLPKAKEENAQSYRDQGFEVYVYDEKQYINGEFEFFGFKPKNCGGVGRQGIAECTQKLLKEDPDTIILELDDDTAGIAFRPISEPGAKVRTIKKWSQLKELYIAIFEFNKNTRISSALRTGATPPNYSFMANRKIFNNFLMYGNEVEFWGFKALCSDDCRFDYYSAMYNERPLVSLDFGNISFTQAQGDRKDGNAPIYNSDFSWKKAYSLSMLAPWAWAGRVKTEGKGTKCEKALFRENLHYSWLFGPIYLEQNNKIVSKLK